MNIKLTPVESREVATESRESKYDLKELLQPTGENPDKVAKVDKGSGKTTDAQRKAIAKYENNFKRINCRITPEMYQLIQSTGESANTIINEALTAYFANRQ